MIFNKFDGNLGKNGELAFIFDRKGIFTIDKSLIKMDWEDFEMEMIDGGAEDIDSDEEEVKAEVKAEEKPKTDKPEEKPKTDAKPSKYMIFIKPSANSSCS